MDFIPPDVILIKPKPHSNRPQTIMHLTAFNELPGN